MQNKGFTRAGAYDCVYDVEKYCKGKRKPRLVILHQSLLPVDCVVCGKPILQEEDNRTWIDPKNRLVEPMHYICSWRVLFEKIVKLETKIMSSGSLCSVSAVCSLNGEQKRMVKDLNGRRKMEALNIFKQECRNWHRPEPHWRARRDVYRYLISRHPGDLVMQHAKWIKAVLDAAEASVKKEEDGRFAS